MQRLFPDPVPEVDPELAYAAGDRRPPSGRPWLLADFIASADGSVTVDGRSGPLGGPGDKAVFRALRHVADAVLVGAGTVRAEGYGPVRPPPEVQEQRRSRGQAAVPPIVVVSRSLQLDWRSRLFTGSEARPVVLTCEAAGDEARAHAAEVADVVVAGDDSVDPGAGLAALAERGADIVCCEGGPTLFGDLAAAGLVDELCLSVAPTLVGGSGPRVIEGAALDPPTGLRLAHVLEEDGFLFLRYLRASPP